MSNQPWTRQRKDGKLEPALWFERFTLYCKLGAARSLMRAQNEYRVQQGNKKYNSVSGSWTNASKAWDWQTRAELWDAFELERLEAKFKADCDEWTGERFKDARALRTRARELMALPVVEEKATDDKGRQFIIKPLSSKHLRDAAAVLKTADELARITTRETQPVTKVAPTTPDGKKPYEPGATIKSEILSALHSISQASAEKDDS